MNLSGQILIAMPGMGDPRFAQSVILVCAHASDGTMGLIINKPHQGLDFAELLEQLNISRPAAGRDSGRDILVHFGGPVERGRGFVLHSADYNGGASTVPVPGNYGMTATLDLLHAIADGTGPAQALLALGYAGWGPGQLEAELARNDWLTAEAKPDLVFSPDNSGKWTAAIRSLGIDPLALSGSAGRA